MSKCRFCFCALFAIVPVIALHWYLHHSGNSKSLKAHTTTTGAIVPPGVRAVRPKYPYSVVSGGVYAPSELQATTQKDPVVREHYADFNVNNARLVKLTDDQYQYVSFRMGNRIYWTKKKLRIPKGEILLSDGTNFARTRCGNRLSAVPKQPTTPAQPREESLSLPPFQPEELPQLSLVAGGPPLPFDGPKAPALVHPAAVTSVARPENWAPLQQAPAIVPIGTAPYIPVTHPAVTPPPGRPSSPAPVTPPPIIPPPVTPPPVAPVPEPASICLLGAGLLVAALGLKRIPGSNQRQNDSGTSN